MIRLAITRPVAVAMAYLALGLLGVAAWRNLPIELLPDTQLPRISVMATWTGASPEATEAFLTAPLEAAIQQVRGVERIQSTSIEGNANISVEFQRETDMDFARLELSERLDAIEADLPAAASPPRIQQYIPPEFEEQTRPFLSYTVTGPYTTEALRVQVDSLIVEELLRVDGVAAVRVSGGRERLLEIELDPGRIEAFGLTVLAVRQRIQRAESIQEAGVVEVGGLRQTLAIRHRVESIEALRRLPILTQNGQLVRIDDVATIRDTFEEPSNHYRIDGQPAISFDIIREQGTNAVQVADRARARLAELESVQAPGIRLILDSDESEAIRAQLSEMRTRALFSAAVIFIVLLLFLRSFRSAGLVFATIAFAVMITLNGVYWSGMSLNVLTLMGLAMGFGLIVDNAIVVLENIYRHRRQGASAATAAERGAKEVVLPVISATLTTLIVVTPFVYLQGELRLFYVPLGLVVGISLLASIFVAFTFIPALAARILRSGDERREGGEIGAEGVGAGAGSRWPGRAGTDAPRSVGGQLGSAPATTAESAATDDHQGNAESVTHDGEWDAVDGTESGNSRARGEDRSPPVAVGAAGRARPDGPLYVRFYRAVTGFTLRWPWLTVAIALLMLGGSWHLFSQYVTRGVVWSGLYDARSFVRVSLSLPRGEELARTDEMARFFEDRLRGMHGVDRFVTRVQRDNATIQVTFPDSIEMTAEPLIIQERLSSYAVQLGGSRISVIGQGPAFSAGGFGGASPNYRIRVFGYNYETVRDIAENLATRLMAFSRIEEVNTNASARGFSRDRVTELVVEPDRARLAVHGLTSRDLVAQVSSAIAGAEGRSSVMRVGGEQVGYAVKLSGHNDMDVLALSGVSMLGQGGGSVRLGEVATVREREVLGQIIRENQQYERSVAYEFRGPSRLGDVIRDAVIETTHLPPGYRIEGSTQFQLSQEDRRQIYTVLALALLLVFMLTAALFESIRQPICVLLTVPMALVGVFLIFFYVGASFTREAYIGVIMMAGIVVNNAILLIDHINRLRRSGMGTLQEAILQGTLDRSRPILMTSATTIFGLLPLVLFSPDADARIWNALGYALIGGLASSTILVLTVTPALYLLFERRAEQRRLEGGPPAEPLAATVPFRGIHGVKT